MRTILVVYTHSKLTKKEYVSLKTYAFNTNHKFKVGERFISRDYDTPMQVVEILDRAYKYVNRANGELGNKRVSTAQFELRELVIVDRSHTNVVLAEMVDNDF